VRPGRSLLHTKARCPANVSNFVALRLDRGFQRGSSCSKRVSTGLLPAARTYCKRFKRVAKSATCSLNSFAGLRHRRALRRDGFPAPCPGLCVAERICQGRLRGIAGRSQAVPVNHIPARKASAAMTPPKSMAKRPRHAIFRLWPWGTQGRRLGRFRAGFHCRSVEGFAGFAFSALTRGVAGLSCCCVRFSRLQIGLLYPWRSFRIWVECGTGRAAVARYLAGVSLAFVVAGGVWSHPCGLLFLRGRRCVVRHRLSRPPPCPRCILSELAVGFNQAVVLSGVAALAGDGLIRGLGFGCRRCLLGCRRLRAGGEFRFFGVVFGLAAQADAAMSKISSGCVNLNLVFSFANA